ncbi:MAG TPA: PepSY domain-containing protein [Sphingobium sp.]|nr:PepSY domain-containing protein [Sphingobium sp.]
MKSRFSRGILVLHRYVGVLLGVLMTLWCLSGFVMMYQGFPGVTEEERLASLQPLNLSAPLALDRLPFTDEEVVRGFRLEMLGTQPVLRMNGRGGGTTYSLSSGDELKPLSVQEVAEVASLHAAGNGIALADHIEPQLMDRLDQWTIQSFRGSQPLYHVKMGDPAGSELYISAASGTVVQDTNRKERVLSWLGAIPHWLYPTVLRENGRLWTEVVIWASVIGTFLTATGLYVGLGRVAQRRKGRLSPYKGLWYWHHVLGLFLGVITLTWVFSGLMTMGPWGLLSGPPNTLRQDIAGSASWAETRQFLERAQQEGLPQGTVQLRPALLGGAMHGIALIPGQQPVRLNSEAMPAPLAEEDVRGALSGLPVAQFTHMTREDAYYYGFKDRAFRPVYRAILDDAQQSRIYVDASTGEVARIVDDAARRSRWLRNGMHSLDFIRGRPLWDVVTLVLLAGVTAVCATGAWMSFHRVSRDIRMFRRRRKGRRLARTVNGQPAVGVIGPVRSQDG